MTSCFSVRVYHGPAEEGRKEGGREGGRRRGMRDYK
jgi:hypothetical protein